MNPNPSFDRGRGREGGTRFRVIALTAFVVPLVLLAAPPAWWQQRGVLRSGAEANDYAPLNQGQLKNLVKAAVAELDEKLPDGAGDDLHSLITSWTQNPASADNYAPVNHGQLKNVAKKIYDRLIQDGAASEYPWSSASNAPDNFAMANIGQAKKVFQFELPPLDPAWMNWLAAHNLPPGTLKNGDFDGDGLSNYQEYLLGADPRKRDSDGDGIPDGVEVAEGSDPLGASSNSRMLKLALFTRLE